MAKKGGGQLQQDIFTDEDLELFLEKTGLLVCDVYTEWSGPCTSVITNLKGAKMALGADNLNLAICKADTITSLNRFKDHCEPTWLFCAEGKAVNLMFGVNVPKLMDLINNEFLALTNPKRPFYEIDELQPEEIDRRNKVLAAEAEARRLEIEEAARKRLEYLDYVSNTIMENIRGYGVTIFGPQVSKEKDMYRKIVELAEYSRLSCKSRTIVQLKPEQADKLHYSCKEPIDPEVLEQLYESEVLICLWETGDGESKPVEEVLKKFCVELQSQQPARDGDGVIIADEFVPPLMENLLVKIKAPPPEVEEIEEASQLTMDIAALSKQIMSSAGMSQMATVFVDENEEEEEEVVEEELPMIQEEAESEEYLKIVVVPPIWTPPNRRTNAIGIYLFFREFTTEFLPPDPPPIPEHLVVVFDAYKKKDVIPLFDKLKDDILLYGYFTSGDPAKAQLIANSTEKYTGGEQLSTDKLIIKVAKKTSNCTLALVPYGPSYVSPNTKEGKREANIFFPEGYKTGEMEKGLEKPKSNVSVTAVAEESGENDEEEDDL